MGLSIDRDKVVVQHEGPPDTQVEFENAIVADTVLYAFLGGHAVYEHKTSDGTPQALKVRAAEFYSRSNADMMHYASTHGILAPEVRGVYDVYDKETLTVVVSERVPGKTLDKV